MKKVKKTAILNFKIKQLLGIAFFILGCFLVLSYSYGITGAVVSGSSFEKISPVFGFVFIIGGLMILVVGRAESLEELLSYTGEVPSAKEEAVVLFDADFVRELDEKALNAVKSKKFKTKEEWLKHNLPPEYFGAYKIEVVPKVREEIFYKPKSTGHNPLAGQEFYGELTKLYNITSSKLNMINPNSTILPSYWLQNSKTPDNKWDQEYDKFIKGNGDYQMLLYAIQRGNRPTIILSNNLSEIKEIGDALRKNKKANIVVKNVRDLGI